MAFKILPNYPHLPLLIETATDFSEKSDEFTRSKVSKIIKELSEIPSIEINNPYKRMKTIDDTNEPSEMYQGTQSIHNNAYDNKRIFFICMDYYIHHPIGIPSSNEFINFHSDLKALFRKKVNSTNVNNSKDYQNWKWDIILQLFESNILSDERALEEALKNKFMKRLLKFYFPSKKDFVSLSYTPENFIYAKVGHHLLKALVNSKVGRKMLSSSQNINLVFGIGFQDSHDNIFKDATCFIQELSELLTEEVKKLTILVSKKPEDRSKYDPKREFNQEKLNTTMMREFVSWIGILTSKIDSVKLLQKKNVFSELK